MKDHFVFISYHTTNNFQNQMVNVIAGKFSFKGCRVAKIKPVVLEDDKEEKIQFLKAQELLEA